MREKILNMLEKNSRIDLKDMAVMLGMTEVEVANEIADMEKEHVICGYNTLINWDSTLHTARSLSGPVKVFLISALNSIEKPPVKN